MNNLLLFLSSYISIYSQLLSSCLWRESVNERDSEDVGHWFASRQLVLIPSQQRGTSPEAIYTLTKASLVSDLEPAAVKRAHPLTYSVNLCLMILHDACLRCCSQTRLDSHYDCLCLLNFYLLALTDRLDRPPRSSLRPEYRMYQIARGPRACYARPLRSQLCLYLCRGSYSKAA